LTFFENVPSIRDQDTDTLRCRTGVCKTRAAVDGAFRRRGSAYQAGCGTFTQEHRATRSIFWMNPPPACILRMSDKLVSIHAEDLRRAGNTVIVIEHNLDVIKCAVTISSTWDRTAATEAARSLPEGTPEEIAKCHDSYTGYYINRILSGKR
jgi:excinuclease ABC subunit A